jgi:nucleoside-diphosphate-sugar epimerase
MKYLVTGATGFLGGVVATQLVAAGHRVTAVVRDLRRAADLGALGVELHQGDVTDKESLRLPMTGVDGVFHIAGWYKIGVPDERAAIDTNVNGTRHVLELMQELGVPKGVYTSTLAVNSDTHGKIVDESYRFTGRHLTLYDRTKAEAHQLAERFMAGGLPLVIVQPGLVYGPGDTSGVRTMFVQYLQRQLPLLPSKAAYAWGHVADIARAHALAMEKSPIGRSYFICGPIHALVEAMGMAQQITGIPTPRLRASPGMLRGAAALMRVVEKVAPVPAAYASESLRVLAGVTYIGSNARARRELGWTPRPLRDGLTETLRHEMTILGMRPRF